MQKCSASGSLLDFNNDQEALALSLIFDVYYPFGVGIKWLEGRDVIAWGGDTAEGVLTGNKAPLSATNFQIRVESAYGSDGVQGRLLNESVYYVQAGGKKVREFRYREEGAGWRSVDMTLFAHDIAGDGIAEVAVQTNPDAILWCVTDDGDLVGLTLEPEYGVAGWHKHTINGDIESVAIIRGSTEDEIYVSVERTINSTTKRFIEYFTVREFGTVQADAFYVDSGLTLDKGAAKTVSGATQAAPVVITAIAHGFLDDDTVKLASIVGAIELNGKVWTVQNKTDDTFELKETDEFQAHDATVSYFAGAIVEYNSVCYISLLDSNLNKTPGVDTDYWSTWPTAYTSGGTATEVAITVSGLDHLEGESVQILADGAAHPNKTVVSGDITLDYYVNKIQVGLGYNSNLRPMRLEAGASKGTSLGQLQKVFKVRVKLFKSLGMKIGRDADNLIEHTFRTGTDPMDSSPDFFTGDVEEVFNGGYDIDGTIYIREEQPLPLNVVSIMPEMETND